MSKTNATNNTVSNKCKRCKNSVTTGLKCVVCGTISHKSCLNALKSVRFIDDVSVNCCLDAVNDITVDVEPVYQFSHNGADNAVGLTTDEIKIKYLEEILRQKDLVIQNQAIAIRSLQDQLSMLRNMPSNFHQHKQSTSKPGGSSKAASFAGAVSKNQINSSKSPSKPSGSSNQISSAAVSHAIHVAQSSRICQDIVQLNQSAPTAPLPGAKPVVPSSSRTRSRNILIGDSKVLANTASLKSASDSACKHFHTTNWDPNTKEEILLSYLKEFAPKVSVEKLNARDPERYASFKVSVPLSDVSKITKPEIWPCGVRVNQFFRARNHVTVS